MGISIHPPREGWDLMMCLVFRWWVFQSTHPVRDGTFGKYLYIKGGGISIHPPREGWDRGALPQRLRLFISIHPPREGWDNRTRSLKYRTVKFQSTHPVRDGTRVAEKHCRKKRFQSTHPVRDGTYDVHGAGIVLRISIHPPREGWDRKMIGAGPRAKHFNPPTP